MCSTRMRSAIYTVAYGIYTDVPLSKDLTVAECLEMGPKVQCIPRKHVDAKRSSGRQVVTKRALAHVQGTLVFFFGQYWTGESKHQAT